MPSPATDGLKTGAAPRRPGRPSVTKKLERVRTILQETIEQDGQGQSYHERDRRKAYRAGINKALAVIAERDTK